MSKKTPKGFEPSREDACIPEQCPISVYRNPYGDVVIREHAPDSIKALQGAIA